MPRGRWRWIKAQVELLSVEDNGGSEGVGTE